MESPVRTFLTLEKPEVGEMSAEDLAIEVEGWRAVMGMLPREILEWLARHHEICRFTLRNYSGHLGLLLNVKFEPVEYVLGTREAAFDSLRGVRLVENKTMTIPASTVLLFESIEEQADYNPETEETALAKVSLEPTNSGGKRG